MPIMAFDPLGQNFGQPGTTAGAVVGEFPPVIDPEAEVIVGDPPIVGPTVPSTSLIQLPAINGLGSFQDIQGSFSLVFLDSNGNLFAENPYPGLPIAGDNVSGIGTVIQLEAPDYHIVPGSFMDTAAAYHRLYMAFSDLKVGTVDPRQFYYDLPTHRFHYNGLGVQNNSVPLTTAVSAAEAGDIAVGTRYAIVMHVTRTGYISGITTAGIKKIEITDEGLSITVTGITRVHDLTQTVPDQNVVARVIAFTQAGSSSAGPYYYIPFDDYVEGLNRTIDSNGNNITKTVIEDNTTLEATFSFPDEYLLGSVDVTNFFDKRPLGETATSGETAMKSVFFSKTLRRLIWCGEDRDTFRVSEADDPETYLGSTGFCQPGQGDEGIAMAAREFRGELYFLKNNGGYLAANTSLTPAEWALPQRWEKSGPEGPWAVDTCNEFMAYAHRSGPYIYMGTEPIWIGFEISGNLNVYPNWDRINWDYAHKIYVTIDTENRMVKFGVPMDRSTKVNMELIVDYSKGWKNRRWSWDDAATTRAIHVKRLVNANDMTLGFDGRIRTAQMLHASNNPDGLILYEDPMNRTLNGAPILQEVQKAFTPYMKSAGIYRLGAVDTSARGQGNMSMTVYGDVSPQVISLDIPLGADIEDHNRKPHGQNERWSVKFSNKGELGNWFELHRSTLWVNLIWQTRSV